MSNKLLLAVNFVGTDKLSGALKNIIGTGKKSAGALKGMKDEARKLERELAGVRREIASGSGNMTKLINQERELERATAGANEKLKAQYKNLSVIAKADQIRARGQELKASGRENIVAGASLAAPLLLAAKAAGDFSSGMVDLQQKAELTDAETAKLKNNIIASAAAIKQLPEDMRAAVDVLAGRGLDPRQAALMAPAIGRLGTAFKVELADGAAAAYANLDNLRIPIEQTGLALDIMAAGANEGAFEVADMAKHFPSLTAQLAALGGTGVPAVTDLTAALEVAMKTAGNSDEAANNIQNLLAKINAPATISAFKKNFGVDLPAAMKKLTDSGMSSMEAIVTITKQATKGDMGKLGFAFNDQQARMGILALIQNFDEYRRIRKNIAAGGGTIDKAFDQRVLNDASVSWNSFMGTASALAITLGTTVLPVMTEMFGALNSGITAISMWAQANPEAAAMVMKSVGAIAALRIGLGALQFAFGGLLGPAASIFKFFGKTNVAGVSRFARVLTLLKGGAMIAGRAILFLGRAMLMNPIGLLVTAIAVAAYGIYYYWDEIKAAFFSAVAWLGQAWANIQTTFMAGVNFIIGLHSQMLGIGKNIIMGLVNGITSAPGAVFNALKNVVMKGITGVKDLLGIKSPSRLFMGLGDYMAQGMEIGITKGGKRAINAAGRMAAGVAGAGTLALSPAGATSIQRAASSGSAIAANEGSAAPITIHVHGAAGQDVNELADIVMTKLKRAQGVNQRSAYSDDA
ncbi:phage tail tape measure protein [Parasphingorhabdus sp. JC815]|uniref:phage tail tape measure protein n=1 Tax=Parasphingorhabdus sp. JC815 TaxID=3232140 RepID=UPI00345984C2